MMQKEVKKKILPTYPNFFEHVTPNTFNLFSFNFWPRVKSTFMTSQAG